jgi:glutamate N-acetyltransferase/amino-acid N-acetyltransferase
LRDGVENTFNAVTIDGDTSTSDTLMAFATGTARGALSRQKSRAPPSAP